MESAPFVSPRWLAGRLGDQRLRIIDVRRRGYGRRHVPGAIRLDTEPLASRPSNLPMLAFAMSQLGIGDEHTVVVYGDAEAIERAHGLCETLRRVGHPDTWILEGGFHAWVAAGGNTTHEAPSYPPASFTARVSANPT